MVDCSHGNSAKDHARQLAVGHEVLRQVHDGQPAIMGLLMESNLQPGRQTWKEGVALQHGVSITDACIGWPETEAFLYAAAEILRVAPVPPRYASL